MVSRILLFALSGLLVSTKLHAQNAAFVKRTMEISNGSNICLNVDFGFKNTNRFLKDVTSTLTKAGINSMKVSTRAGRSAILTQSSLVLQSETAVYRLESGENNKRKISQMANGTSVKSEVLPSDGDIMIIDGKGSFLYTDYSHGSATSILFYDPDLKLQSTYHPFKNSFVWLKIGFSENLVCVYAIENYKSQNFKISILSHDGKLLREALFSRDDYLASDIEMTSDNIIVLYTSPNSAETRISSYDYLLQPQWTAQLSSRIRGYDLVVDNVSNSVLFGTLTDIVCLNSVSGSEVWKISLGDHRNGIQGPKYVKIDCISGKYAILNVGIRKNDVETIENELSVLVIDSGNIVHREFLGDCQGEIELYGGKDGFLATRNLIANEFEF